MCSVEGEPWVGDRERKRAGHTSRYPCQPHAIVICSGRDRSPVKGLKMWLLVLFLGLSGLEPQPRVFQKSLCPDVGAERKKDT